MFPGGLVPVQQARPKISRSNGEMPFAFGEDELNGSANLIKNLRAPSGFLENPALQGLLQSLTGFQPTSRQKKTAALVFDRREVTSSDTIIAYAPGLCRLIIPKGSNQTAEFSCSSLSTSWSGL